MADSREERMQQRMRGAGRHEVADESFGLILPVEESPEASPEAPTPQPPAQPEPAPVAVSRSTPNTSAKRRRLASDAPRTEQEPRSTRSESSRQSSSASKPDPYEIAPEPEPEPGPEPVPEFQPEPQHASKPLRSSPAVLAQNTNEQPKDAEPSIAASGPAQWQASRGSVSPGLSGGANMVEEVTESPANAPGSGHRRRVRDSSAVATQSTQLQKAVMMEDNELTGGVVTSSPLARKTRTSGSTSGNLSARTTRTSGTGSLAEAADIGDASSSSAHSERNTPAPASGSSQSSGSRRSTRSALLGQPAELSSPVPLVESRRRARAKAKASRMTPAGGSEEMNELTGPQTKPKSTRRVAPAASAEEEDEMLEAPAKPAPKQTRAAGNVRKATGVAKTQAKPKHKRAKAPEEAPEEAEEDVAAPPKPKTKAARTPAETQEAGGEEAEEIRAREAAPLMGKKRGRPTPARKPSPELNARASEDERPAKKRRQRRSQESPAQQSQPKPPKNISEGKTKTKTKTQSTGNAAKARRRHSSGEDIPIAVQRYNNPRPRSADDSEPDVLQMEMPFANRNGVNVVDVLSQICDEVIESSLEGLLETAAHAETAAAKREYKTKIRAVKSFQEELRTRLIQHTIALDSMHALKKRVRAMQKEKVALRKEILGIRAEREQVALKMDAIRMQHEAEGREAMHHLSLSSTMHDIELAIDQGRLAPEPNAKELKLAELANLEFLVSCVAGQACVGEGGGGTLKQIRDFNAFLERTAAALETR